MVNIGKWSFIAGVVIAILAGFATIPNLVWVLLILGIIVGFLNITKEQVTPYLIAVTALLIIGVAVSQSFSLVGIGLTSWAQSVLGNFLTFVAASGLVVAIKAVIQLGRPD